MTTALGNGRASSPRYLRAGLVGLCGAIVVIAAIAVSQLGVSRSKAVLVEVLDDWHIVGRKTTVLRNARRMERADPVQDAKKALSSGDRRLLGFVYPELTGPVTLPGISESLLERYRGQFGVRVLFVGGVDWPEFDRYEKAVRHYAAQYNKTLTQAATP